MENIPIISLYGPSIRPRLWKAYYENVCQACHVPFEIVFSGPCIEDPQAMGLPDNFRYIHTANIKPAQCWMVSFWNTRGPVVTVSADDHVLRPNAIDTAYEVYWKNFDSKIVVELNMLFQGMNQRHSLVYPMEGNIRGKKWAQVPGSFSLRTREFVNEWGGFDRRFLMQEANMDFFLRALKAGAKVIYCENAIADEDVGYAVGTHGVNLGSWSSNDRHLLDAFWIDGNGSLRDERSQPFEPYANDATLTQVSQGARDGRWA